MNWLLKTEPSDYSFDDLASERRAVWDGVANALALKNLRQARRGEQALIYHTGKERSAVGLARILTDPYPDPKAHDERLVVVEVAPVRRLPRAVPLDEMKKNPRLKGFDLLRLGRLSVVPVFPGHWSEILAMAGMESEQK